MSLLKGESESSMLKEILGNIEFLGGKTDGCPAYAKASAGRRLRVARSESQMTTVSEKKESGLKTVDRLPFAVNRFNAKGFFKNGHLDRSH